jgi:hypothetical protein
VCVPQPETGLPYVAQAPTGATAGAVDLTLVPDSTEADALAALAEALAAAKRSSAAAEAAARIVRNVSVSYTNLSRCTSIGACVATDAAGTAIALGIVAEGITSAASAVVCALEKYSALRAPALPAAAAASRKRSASPSSGSAKRRAVARDD